jgi:prepilin-type N-terminal cleavage/methylation domain-containing protein
MNEFNPSNRLGSRRVRPAAVCGFTLVEIMVVVTIISLLAMLAIPTMQKIRRKARASAIANDFRVFATAFLTYSHENGAWPAESAAGITPTGMDPYLKGGSWPRISPMGGHYNWDNSQLHQGGFRPHAAIAISATGDAPLLIDADQLKEIDFAIDDGDLTTGNFRLGSGNAPLFVVEP